MSRYVPGIDKSQRKGRWCCPSRTTGRALHTSVKNGRSLLVPVVFKQKKNIEFKEPAMLIPVEAKSCAIELIQLMQMIVNTIPSDTFGSSRY